MEKKILPIEKLQKFLNKEKKKGKKIVLCHGVFDLLHVGHINYFKSSKSHGDILVVSLTSDKFVNKGPGRPFFKLNKRLETIAALECVDIVVESNFSDAIETKLVEATTAAWEFWYGLLLDYYNKEGHCLVPEIYEINNYKHNNLKHKLILYKILLCIEDPYVPGSAEAQIGNTPLLNNCKATIFDSPDGKDIEIIPEVETGILDGAESLILPINNYNYGVVVISNHIQIKHSAKFVPRNNIGHNDSATLNGYNEDQGGSFSTSNTCFTVAGQATSYSTNSTTHINSRGDTISLTAVNMFSDTPHDTLALACNDGGISGYQIEIIDSLNTRYRSGVKEPADGDGKTGCESSTWKTATGKDCSNTYGGHEDYFDPSADGVDIAGRQ